MEILEKYKEKIKKLINGLMGGGIKMIEGINKLSLPAVVLIASIILGGFFYASQVNKQRSIERQQWIKLQDDRRAEEIVSKRADLKLKQEECKSLSSGVIKKWSNVMGVTYDDEVRKECVVTYIGLDSGKVEISPLRSMETSK